MVSFTSQASLFSQFCYATDRAERKKSKTFRVFSFGAKETRHLTIYRKNGNSD